MPSSSPAPPASSGDLAQPPRDAEQEALRAVFMGAAIRRSGGRRCCRMEEVVLCHQISHGRG